ncbi:PspC domain-containing protein [Kocuria soli]|uniref:PspC domain-containing protein n=1 Tax=Kocuria soli TaxID=2485125 RepID=A0A3N3ZP45_9MICC|nr:PspC domain-containing protein [Kocuria soli]ROZ62701.1 PspC domain-containing protein [Kocuria soli]
MNQLLDSIRGPGFQRGPQRLVAGIAGGLAEQFGLNVWLVRLIVLASFLLPFLGIGLYLGLWALTPWQDGRIPLEEDANAAPRGRATSTYTWSDATESVIHAGELPPAQP